MTRNLLILATLATGCAAPLPQYYSVSSEFSPTHRVLIHDAIDAWCESVDWCPEPVAWSERGRFGLSQNYSQRGRARGSAAYNDGDNVVLDAKSRAMDPAELDAFWLLVAHEAGHWGIEGHTSDGLMAAKFKIRQPQIDAEAQREWCSQNGCEAPELGATQFELNVSERQDLEFKCDSGF